MFRARERSERQPSCEAGFSSPCNGAKQAFPPHVMGAKQVFPPHVMGAKQVFPPHVMGAKQVFPPRVAGSGTEPSDFYLEMFFCPVTNHLDGNGFPDGGVRHHLLKFI